MAKSKVDQFINTELGSIMNDSREYKAFSLGCAYGHWNLYKYLIGEIGKERADKIYDGVFTGDMPYNKYLNSMAKLDAEPDSKADELYAKFKRFV